MILQKAVPLIRIEAYTPYDHIRAAFYNQGYAIADSDAALMWAGLPDVAKADLLIRKDNEVVEYFLNSHCTTIPSYHVEGTRILQASQFHSVYTCSVCGKEIPPSHYYLKVLGQEAAHICGNCLESGKVSLTVDFIPESLLSVNPTPPSPVPVVETPDDTSSLFTTHLVNYVKAVLPHFKVDMRETTALVGGYYELRFPAFPLEQGVEVWGGGIRVRSRRIRDVESALSYIKESLNPELLAKDTKKLVNAVMESRIPKSNLGWIVQMSGLTRSRIGLLLSLPSGGEDDILSLIEVGCKSCPDKVDRNVAASMDSVHIAVGGLYSPDAYLHQVIRLKWKGSR